MNALHSPVLWIPLVISSLYAGEVIALTGIATEVSQPAAEGTIHFSREAGFYEEAFFLTLSANDPEAAVIYTLDGSDPVIEGLSGKTYTYKNHYPYRPGYSFGELITGEIRSYLYEEPLYIRDRSGEPDKLTQISSTFYPNHYAPKSPVQKATVVKARIVKDGHHPGPVVTHTYFITKHEFTLPILSISVSEDLLFDYENGIYVPGRDFDEWRAANPNSRTDGFTPANYQRDIEHQAYLEIFDGDPVQRVVNQNIGIKLAGSVSLYYPEKSIRMFARSEYGKSTIPYAFFPDLPFSEYKRITLRNSGNDNPSTMFRDAAIQESVRNLSFGTQAYRPAIVFLNGEYWGIHNMRQHLDKHYLSSMYDADPDNIDVLELPDIQEGDRDHYDRLFEFLQNNSVATTEDLEYVRTQVDVDNFTDYQIAQIFSSNTDWPGRNVRIWRARAEYQPDAPAGADGRWRWLMKDTDFGFGLTTTQAHNTLAFATNAEGAGMPNPWWSTLLLRRLLENSAYREKFINRFADLLNSTFEPGRLVAVIDRLKNGIEAEMPRHIARWKAPESMASWKGNVNAMIDFVRNRPDRQRQHIVDHFGLDGTRQLTVDVSHTDRGSIRINTIEIIGSTAGISSDPYPWSGIYFAGVPVTMTAIEYPGYRFVKWLGADLPDEKEVKIDLHDNTFVTALFVKETDGVWRTNPRPGASDVSVDPLFEWTPSPAKSHKLQVSLKPDFENPLIDESVIGQTTFSPELPLDPETEYFWRMKVSGSEHWSEVWSFTTGMFLPVGIEGTLNASSVYPNPAQRDVSVGFSPLQKIDAVVIRDLPGRVISRVDVPQNERMLHLDLSGYPKGIYILIGENKGGRAFVKRLVLN